MPLPADVKIPDRDELVKNSTWQERETDEFKHVHQPWALDTEEKKLAAYKELLGGDYHAVIMNSPGVAHLMAQGPEMSRMMAELKTNPKAIEKFILSGLPCGMVAMAALSQDLLRRRVLPPNKPEEKPLGPSEAKDYATKLFQCKKFAHAADQYAQAIAMVDQRPPVLFGVITDPDAPGGVKVTVKPRPAKALEDQKLLPSLYANLAACRVKQHRWPEVIGACDKSLKIEPMYTKAYLRRGEAKRRLKHYDEAVADGRSAIASAANDPEEKRADLIREAEQLIDSVQKEVAQRAADKKRQSMEKDGIELGEGDPIYGMDFDHILRRELRRLLPEPMVWIEEPPDTSEYGMRGKPENFVPKPRVGMCRVEEELPIDGPEFVVEASVRARGAKRFLYYMIDVDVPWRGICYETGGKPHWNHDVFRGKARVFNCNHYTEDTDWGMYVTEKPVNPEDVPTVTPGGHPIEPMIPLNADGTVNTDPPKRCNQTQEMILNKYGPDLVKKLKVVVHQAIENLRKHLGEYRALPHDEAEARRAAQQLKREAELHKWKADPDFKGGADGKEGEGTEVDDDDDDDDDRIEEIVIAEPTGVA